MELLVSYGDDSDSERAVKDSSEQLPKNSENVDCTISENRIDYLGLDTSDSSEEEDCEVRNKCPRYDLDTVISAYQLSELKYGPTIGSENVADGFGLTTMRTPKSQHLEVQLRDSHDDIERCGESLEDIVVDVVPPSKSPPSLIIQSANIFRPEPRAMKSCSRLPRNEKWRFTGHTKSVNTLDWGCVDIQCTHLLLSSSMDGCVRIWNSLSGRCVWNFTVSSETPSTVSPAVRCARWSPGGRTVGTGGYDKMARVIDVETSSQVFAAVHQHYVECLKFHTSERSLLVCGNTGRIDCWDTRMSADRGVVRCYRGDFGEVQDLEFLPGGSEMISCNNLVTRDSANRTIMAWDFRTSAVLSNQIFNERYHCTRLRLHPSGRHFLAQTNGNYVAIFSVVRPYRINKKKRFEGHKVEGYWIGCDVSPDGRFVYSGSSDGKLHVYDFRTSAPLMQLSVSRSPCLAVECHPLLDSKVVISDVKGDIHVWQ